MLTFDTDWAPDFAIQLVADELIRRKLRATWFVTHRSPAIDALAGVSLFELGVHPNFLPGSTHGGTTLEVLSHCLAIVPGATSMRTHALVQSTPIFETVLAETPIRTDVSMLMPGQPAAPFTFHLRGRSLLRVPYHWEDDVEMGHPTPSWEPTAQSNAHAFVPNFHPIHVYLNSADFSRYRALRATCPRLTDLKAAQAAPFVNSGVGTGTAFQRLIEELDPSATGCIRDLRAQ